VIQELEQAGDLGAELVRRARQAGMMLVWRAQRRTTRRVLVTGGRTEDSRGFVLAGQGLQIIAPDGRTALGSRDGFDPDPTLALLDRTMALVSREGPLHLHRKGILAMLPLSARDVPEGLDAFERIDPAAVARRLVEIESEIGAEAPGATLRLSFQAELDAWRILRSDGTDVLYAAPRCTLRMAATSGGEEDRHSVAAAVAGPDPGLPFRDGPVALFLQRGTAAARLARALPDAPPHPAGTFPLVIDYALAKGLAHEAFGHAAEADGFRSSILAREGRFLSGETVGASHVSIVDEPMRGDHAWQPFSANGLRRERATIVDRGRLADALSDPWSAGPGGVRLTGAERAESYRHAPVPRMSNIRIEAEGALPAPGTFEEYGPAEVRDLLDGAGVLRRHPRIAFLSGYSGGQVNAATGDFVFHCKAIHALGREGIRLHRPAIFSGSMLGALGAIREALGPLLLDAIGTCGKLGQSVPSSGGSHYFLVLDPDPSFRLGGS
jgi:TldD protein